MAAVPAAVPSDAHQVASSPPSAASYTGRVSSRPSADNAVAVFPTNRRMPKVVGSRFDVAPVAASMRVGSGPKVGSPT